MTQLPGSVKNLKTELNSTWSILQDRHSASNGRIRPNAVMVESGKDYDTVDDCDEMIQGWGCGGGGGGIL